MLKQIALVAITGLTLFTATISQAATYTTQTVTTTTTTTTNAPYCREYTQALTINGQTQTGYGTACLQSDGSWEIQQPVQNSYPKTRMPKTRMIEYKTHWNRIYVMPSVPFPVYYYPGHIKPYRHSYYR